MKRYFISFAAYRHMQVLSDQRFFLRMEKWFDFFFVDWKSCWWIYEFANILLNKPFIYFFHSHETYVASHYAHATLSIRRIHLHCACIVSVDKYAYLLHWMHISSSAADYCDYFFIELMRIAHQRYFTALCTVAQCRQCEKKEKKCSTAWNKRRRTAARDLKTKCRKKMIMFWCALGLSTLFPFLILHSG